MPAGMCATSPRRSTCPIPPSTSSIEPASSSTRSLPCACSGCGGVPGASHTSPRTIRPPVSSAVRCHFVRVPSMEHTVAPGARSFHRGIPSQTPDR